MTQIYPCRFPAHYSFHPLPAFFFKRMYLELENVNGCLLCVRCCAKHSCKWTGFLLSFPFLLFTLQSF